jgi:hypothetical protein
VTRGRVTLPKMLAFGHMPWPETIRDVCWVPEDALNEITRLGHGTYVRLPHLDIPACTVETVSF